MYSINKSCAFFCVPLSSQLSAECQFLPCWAAEWAMGSLNSTRWKGLEPGILSLSLGRCSLGSQVNSLPPPILLKLPTAAWRWTSYRWEYIACIQLLGSGRTSPGFGGHGIGVVKKQIFPESPVWSKQQQWYRLPCAKWQFVGLQPPELCQSGFCTFGCAWKKDLRPTVLCVMFEHHWPGLWLSGCVPSSVYSGCSCWNEFLWSCYLAGWAS